MKYTYSFSHKKVLFFANIHPCSLEEICDISPAFYNVRTRHTLSTEAKVSCITQTQVHFSRLDRKWRLTLAGS